MAKLNLIHSPRVGKKGTAPILIQVSHKAKTAYIKTDISVEPGEFADGLVIKRKDARMLNNILNGFMLQVNANLLRLTSTIGIADLDVKELRDRISPSYDPIVAEEKLKAKRKFVFVYEEFNATHDNKATRDLYNRTLVAMREFDRNLDDLSFEDIDHKWLNRFKTFRSSKENSNTISIHIVHIRAVFNYAINDLEITTAYPFRKKKGIKRVTIDSVPSEVEPMPLAHLREMWKAKLEPWQERWVDLAKLVFLFIGINMVDMADLTEVDQNGYINYRRHKTRDRSLDGAFYHIKVEPEAMKIINKWRGKEHLLSLFDGRANYQSASKQMVHAVKCIGLPPASKGGQGHKADLSRHSKQKITENSKFGYFCLYSLRKAWATIAFNECGIPMEVISMALGHSDGRGMSVTQRYVYADNKLIDDANRKVIDFVLYNKKPNQNV